MRQETPNPLFLPPDLIELLEQIMDVGRYSSPTDAIRAALLSRLREEDGGRAELIELRRQIAEGIEQDKRGDVVDGNAVMSDWRRLDDDDAAGARRSA